MFPSPEEIESRVCYLHTQQVAAGHAQDVILKGLLIPLQKLIDSAHRATMNVTATDAAKLRAQLGDFAIALRTFVHGMPSDPALSAAAQILVGNDNIPYSRDEALDRAARIIDTEISKAN